MFGKMQLAAAVVAVGAYFGIADQARADVAGQQYLITTNSTESGTFGSVLNFSGVAPAGFISAGTFNLLAENLEVGAGAYVQLNLGFASIVRARGLSTSGYRGSFMAVSIGNLIAGQGTGNADDQFTFFGF